MNKISAMSKAEWESYSLDTYRFSHYQRFNSESRLADYNKRCENHWFDADSKRFFSSRIGAIYHGQSPADWNIFVSSERNTWSNEPRMYTVRQLQIDGGVESLSEFQQYSSSAQARRAIEKYLKNGTPFKTA